MAQVAIAVAIGAVTAVGSYLLFSRNQNQSVQNEGSRLNSSRLTSSTEGAGQSQLFGRQRLNGQIIWATEFKETVNTETTKTSSGGKGGGGGSSTTTTTTTYTYSISLAIAFCKGNSKATISRMWADGDEIDMSLLNFRFYPGSDTQTADPKIEEVQGAGNVPAYRGTAYVVIEDMELASYGNRVPQITAEIVVPIETDDPVDIQNSGEAFCLIPASGESIYATSTVLTKTGGTNSNPTTKPDNVHNAFREPDVKVSLDNLFRMQNNLDAILLVVGWFGDDLRAGSCTIRPRIEDSARVLTPAWTVGSYNRGNTQEVSKDGQGRPIYGGTPSDASVTQLIQYIKSKGKRVIFYPFILMDIPTGNTLPNPYSNNAAGVGQVAFPWRGRITASPAEGYTGSVDKTAAAATQINAWFDEYDDMVTHYANLCASAGGVDGFVIGSELVTITKTRSAEGVYPGVSRLVSLAATVKGIVGGGTDVTYAADWSEWYDNRSDGHWFHLDPLWSSANIDACGVDNYLPMSDWRDGAQHLDYDGVNGPVSEYEPDYLKSNIEGGEYYDWYYASYNDRVAQIRTPITDGLGKPWVFRNKDFRNWWLNQHYNRPGYVEDASPTGWVPGSKPIWFTEFGVPAIDKGTNQPNVFYDPKSSESAFPYFSDGTRDDFIQRVAVEATLDYWKNNTPDNGSGLKMVEPHNMFVWTWDARPFPDYPARDEVWSDGDLWFKGHWWTGRIESVPLARLVAQLCERAGLTEDQYDVSGLYGPGGLVRGFEIGKPEKIRASIQSLMEGHLFDAFESEGKIKFLMRSNTKTSSISSDDFVVTDEDPVGVSLTRGQETELPASVKVTFIDEFNDYNSGSVDGKTSRGYSQNIEQLDLPLLLTADYCRSLADGLVQQRWIERQAGQMKLPPSLTKLDPGDAITFPVGSHSLTGRLTLLSLGEDRNVEFAAFDPGIFSLPASPEDDRLPPLASIYGEMQLVFLDLPLFTGEEALPWAPRFVTYGDPWPGEVSLYRQLADSTYEFNARHPYKNAIGELTAPLYSAPPGIWDRGNTLSVAFDYGALSSVSELLALSSALALGVYNEAKDEWEVIQFATATLTGANAYDVTDLLRGQLGTENAMGDPVPTGAPVVLLEPAFLGTVTLTDAIADEELTYSWGPSRYPQSDDTYRSGTHQGKRVGLRPYAPTGLLMSVNGSGDLTVTWKRRTRFNGDSWSVDNPPLNEEAEQYRLRIYDGSTIVREVELTTPTYTYSAADQTTDFGSSQTTLKVDVAQYGGAYGNYGSLREETLKIRSATP